jgi:uncharacterized protein YggE
MAGGTPLKWGVIRDVPTDLIRGCARLTSAGGFFLARLAVPALALDAMKTLLLITMIGLGEVIGLAQEGGNLLYGGPRRRTPATEGNGLAPAALSGVEPSNSVPVAFLEASVLLNAPADEYQAVFALVQEGATVADSHAKSAAQLKEFLDALQALGVKTNDLSVDFIAQNRVYTISGMDNNLQEHLTGFEVKQNVAVRYRDRAFLEKLLAAAAKSSIFDLVKVDYVVGNVAGLREQLLAAAARVIKRKEASYAQLLGVKMKPCAVDQEKYTANYPADMYSSYRAYESGTTERYNARVAPATKTRTFYYNPLDPGQFDTVAGPAGLEPKVQLTLSLRMKYTVVR